MAGAHCPWSHDYPGFVANLRQRSSDIPSPSKNTICLWYNRDAEDAARFYASPFPDSSVGRVSRAPADFSSRKQGDVLTVEAARRG